MSAQEHVLDEGPLRKRINPTYIIKGTVNAMPPPETSWWIGKDRDALSAAVIERDRQMRHSHRWRSMDKVTAR